MCGIRTAQVDNAATCSGICPDCQACGSIIKERPPRRISHLGDSEGSHLADFKGSHPANFLGDLGIQESQLDCPEQDVKRCGGRFCSRSLPRQGVERGVVLIEKKGRLVGASSRSLRARGK